MTDEKEPTMNERLSAYVDDALAPGDRAALEKALAESPDLRRELSRLKTLRSLLRSMPTPAPSFDFYRNVRRAAEPRRWRFVLPPLAAAAAAALVMVAVHRDARRTVDLDAFSPGGSAGAPPRPAGAIRRLAEPVEIETNLKGEFPATRPSGDYNAVAAPADGVRRRETGALADKGKFADVPAKQRLQAAEPREERSDLPPAPATAPIEEKENLPGGPRPRSEGAGRFLEKAKRAEIQSPVPAAKVLKILPAKDDESLSSLSGGIGGGGAPPSPLAQNRLVGLATPAPATGALSKDESARAAPERSKRGPTVGFRLPQESPPGTEWRGDDSGVLQFRTVVVRDLETWRTLWAQHVALRTPPVPVPVVDFTRHMVVGVFLGQKPSGGFEAILLEVREGPAGATATYRAVTPDPDQSQITVLTAPYHLRVVPRTAGAVRFKKIP